MGVMQRNGKTRLNRALDDAYRPMLAEHAAQTGVLLVFVSLHFSLFTILGLFRALRLRLSTRRERKKARR